ncbi:hypothetical protein BKA62DRAFT_756508 [Auriculariales sp. MPI-PUGE-AT-0066]|nr:hypothetical protein BKA62DRAFT_756508 [Auriculariales sp. MPI-PUGE-AT-0066]
MSPLPSSSAFAYAGGHTIIQSPNAARELQFIVLYLLVVAGRKHIASFAGTHIFGAAAGQAATGERTSLLRPETTAGENGAAETAARDEITRKILFPGVAASAGCLLINAFLLWDGLAWHDWIMRYLGWWLTLVTAFVASAFLLSQVESFKESHAEGRTSLEKLGRIGQECGVVLTLLPIASLLTRYSYYTRVYIGPFDTFFIAYVLQPILGVWAVYWGTTIGAPFNETAPSSV